MSGGATSSRRPTGSVGGSGRMIRLARQPPELSARIVRFVRTVADPGPLQGRLVVCVTHSPVLRAVLLSTTGEDPGEPAYVTGAEIIVRRSAELTIRAHDPLVG